jgi:integrase
MPLDNVYAPPTVPALTETQRHINRLLDASKAKSTRRSYGSDVRQYEAWCAENGFPTFPAEPATIIKHIAWAALPKSEGGGLTASSIGRRLCAIAHEHKTNKLANPIADYDVKEILKGIRRTIGTAPRPKTPLTHDLVQRLLNECDASLIGIRDRALVALGFAGAFRRAELVALGGEDLEPSDEGFRVRIRRSKTDQEGKGATIAIPRGYKLKPVEAVERWLEVSGITDGPLFRQVGKGGRLLGPMSGHAVAEVLKKLCVRAGLDPALYSGHSLRSGFLTSAADAGASPFKMQAVSRHKSLDVLSGYVRSADLFNDHAGSSFL